MTLRIVATRICAEQPSSSNSHIESLKRQLATSQYHVHPTNRKPPTSSFALDGMEESERVQKVERREMCSLTTSKAIDLQVEAGRREGAKIPDWSRY